MVLKNKLLITAMASAMLSGCSSLESKKMQDTVNGTVDRTSTQVDGAMNSAMTDGRYNENAAVQTQWSDTPLLSVKKIRLKERLPGLFSRNVFINEPFPKDLKDLLLKASQQSGVEIIVEDDVTASSTASDSDLSQDLVTDSAGVSIDGILGASTAQGFESPTLSISYSGDVSGLMTALSSKLNAKWRYDSNESKVVIYKNIQKIFYIPSIPGSSSINASVDSTVSESSRKAGFDSQLSVWDSINKDMTTIIGLNDTESFTLSESSGLLTVRATPEKIAEVTSYIDKVKEGMRSQVLIDIQILSLTTELEDNKEVNLGLLLETGGMSVNMASGAASTLTGASSFIFTALQDQVGTGAGNSFNLKKDSTGVLNLLNTVGKAAVVANIPIRTVNNQPSAISRSIKSGYLAKSEITVDPTTGVQNSSLTTATEKTGLSINVLPTLDENGRDMLLQIAFSLSDISKYDIFETKDGSQSIVPVINSRDFVEKVWLESGQTLVLSGFDFEKSDSTSSGPMDSSMWGLGGAKKVKSVREQIVILITPRTYNAVTQNKI